MRAEAHAMSRVGDERTWVRLHGRPRSRSARATIGGTTTRRRLRCNIARGDSCAGPRVSWLPSARAARGTEAEGLREGPLRGILAALEHDGEEARVVGGAVRNALIGEPHGDIDIATTALPPEVIRRVEAAGFKAVPTGIEHGTVTVVAAGRPFEVTTLREDVETFGRHATVAFGRDWKRDAQRRDFTMNAPSLTRD